MKKSTPPTIKHLHCQCRIVVGPFGPHKRKIVCSDHNDAFVQWVSKDFEQEDWPDQSDSYILERVKNQNKIKLATDSETIFDKIKYSDLTPIQKALNGIKKIQGEIK